MAISAAPGYAGLSSKNPLTRAATAASLGFISPTPNVKIGASGGGSLTNAITGGQRVTVNPITGVAAPYVAPPSGGGTVTTVRTPLQVYQDQILGDPQAVAAQGTYDTTLKGLANARQSGIQQAIYNAGWSPFAVPGGIPGALQDYAGDFTGGPDPSQNTMSQKAQLDKQLSDANYLLPYQLASTGMGRSGAYAVNASNLQNQYDTASYGGMQDLLNAILGYASNYASGVTGAANQLDAARAAVAQRLQNAAGYSETVTSDGGGGGGDPNVADPYTGYYPEITIPDVVSKVIDQISSKPVSANRTGATVQKGRGVISIH